MTTFPNPPNLLKGGLVLIDPATARVQRIVSLQYNPESLSCSLRLQGFSEGGERSEALRLKGPALQHRNFEGIS